MECLLFENEYDKEQSTTFKNVSYVSSGSLTTILEKGTEIQNINVTTATRHDNATRRTYAEAKFKKWTRQFTIFFLYK